jgi:hypothetical protein
MHVYYSAEAQIAALEAKLNSMQHSPLAIAAGTATPESEAGPSDKGKRRAESQDDVGPLPEDAQQRAKKAKTERSDRPSIIVPPPSAG